MVEGSIPVDLFNAGQVFACLGFLEAAEVLLGEAEGGFEWTKTTDSRFGLRANGDENPFAVVLGFLAEAEIRVCAPFGYCDPPRRKKKSGESEDEDVVDSQPPDLSETFPCREADRMALPIRLVGHVAGRSRFIEITHWSDASGRDDFKLYAGIRSGADIARAMLHGTREKPKKKQDVGDVKTRGVDALWKDSRRSLHADPFGMLTPMGGSFGFDARRSWTAIGAGYSPNDQKHKLAASPVVEILAAMGLEHARPDEYDTRRVRYGAWGCPLPPLLARPTLAGARVGIPVRMFRFVLDLAGKNKVVTFAQEETSA